MMQWAYLVSLILSITGVSLIDRRYRLAFWYDRKRTVVTLTMALLVFISWDLIAIGMGIFIHGNSAFSLPFTIVPHFPVEEIFFLFLLCYCTLALYRGAQKLWPRI